MTDKTQVAEARREEATLLPPVNVIEDASGITLYADLPGVPKEKLNLQVEADTLSIEGEIALDLPEGMEATHAEVELPLSPYLQLAQGTRQRKGKRRVQAGRAQTAHSQSRACPAAPYRGTGALRQLPGASRPAS